MRVERFTDPAAGYVEHYALAAILEGAFDSWYRGATNLHAAGALKLKEPGEVHRDLRVHAAVTLQSVAFEPELVAHAAEALGLRGPVHFAQAQAPPGSRATALAFALHRALLAGNAGELEVANLAAEALAEVLRTCGEQAPPASRPGGVRAVRRARAYLHEALATKVTLEELAHHAGVDKFHLVRAFREEVGLPPYEYLTHLRVARAQRLLAAGLTAAATAQEVGLYDESQLHRHLRRIVGMTPGRLARALRGSNIAQAPAAPRLHAAAHERLRPRPRHDSPR